MTMSKHNQCAFAAITNMVNLRSVGNIMCAKPSTENDKHVHRHTGSVKARITIADGIDTSHHTRRLVVEFLTSSFIGLSL